MMNNPVRSLHQNVDQFFSKIEGKYKSELKCKVGCTQCCHVDLSISQAESSLIEEWLEQKNDDEKDELKKIWGQAQPLGKSYTSDSSKPCAFLYDGKCSIYEVRPVICRSHGIALIRQSDEQTKEIDACSLNFQVELPPMDDCLDLDRLNTLLAVANKVMGFDDTRTRLKKLKEKLLKS